MRATDFSIALFDALQFSGNDRQNISDETFAQFRDFCSFRLRESWEAHSWSDVCKLVKLETETADDKSTYVTLPDDCSELFEIFSKNPHATTQGIVVEFQLYNDNGTNKAIMSSMLQEVWCFYRTKCPVLSGDLYNETTVYYLDSQVYFDSGSGTGTFTPVAGKPHKGNFYTCLVSYTSAGENPSTNPEKWQKVEIPYIFASYLSWGAAANYFASEMMVQEAATIEAKAREVLELEYDKALRQQGQFGRMNMVKTY